MLVAENSLFIVWETDIVYMIILTKAERYWSCRIDISR